MASELDSIAALAGETEPQENILRVFHFQSSDPPSKPARRLSPCSDNRRRG